MNELSASADLLRLLAAVAQSPAREHAEFASALDLPLPASPDNWRIAHTEAFIRQCPAHVSFVVGEGGRIGGEAADRVADFRRMLGVSVQPGQADYLPDVLADYAELVAQASDDPRAQHARAAMLWEHLLAWVAPYLDSLARSAPTPYNCWAVLTRDVLYIEAERVAPPIEQLPLHLRTAPPVANLLEADSADQAIRVLLTPLQSGIVLTHSDLARAAVSIKVDSMHNTRSAMAKYLLEQDSTGALSWLARFTREQAIARTADYKWLGSVATFWSARAKATADALATMAEQAAKQSLVRCG